MGRAGAAAKHGCEAGIERIVNLLRADEMDMRIHAACRENFAFTGNRLCARPDNDGDAVLRIGITGLADRSNAPITQTDIGFIDACMIDDQRIGDDGIDRAFSARVLALAHAIADDFATAKFHFFAVNCEIALNYDEQFRVSKANFIANGRAKHSGIGSAGES